MEKRTWFMMLLACALMVTGAYATTADEEIVYVEYVREDMGFPYEAVKSDSAYLMADDNDSVEKKIVAGLLNCDSVIFFDKDDFVYTFDKEIDSYKDNKLIAMQFIMDFSVIVDKYPEIFYLGENVGYGYEEEGDTYRIVSVFPTYTFSGSALENVRQDFKNLTEEISQYINENGKSDLEKAILLHDYIVLNFEYDSTKTIFDAYTFLKDGKGVCESYSKLYRYVLGLCDIESKYASSDAMEHLWNIVNIDGEWYHVDVTWDDSAATDPDLEILVPDVRGKIHHDYFLIGDADIQNPEIWGENGIHHDYITEDGIECEKSFDNNFWRPKINLNSDKFVYAGSPIVFDEENFYYTGYNYKTNESSIIACSKDKFSEQRNVITFTDLWKVNGANRYYRGNYSGLSLIDGVLIYNTPTEIRYVLPNGNHDKKIKDIELLGIPFGQIYRFVTSLDGIFDKKEPYYTHIDLKNVKTNKTAKHNYKDGKDMYHVEIDYFIAPNYGSSQIKERDIDVYLNFNKVHGINKPTTMKPSYVTPGEERYVCEKCNMYETISKLLPPLCQEGENAHEKPVIEDVQNVIKSVLGVGPLVYNNVDNDVNGDGKLSMRDIFLIFQAIKNSSAS